MRIKREYKSKTKELLKNISSLYKRRQILISKIKLNSIILDEDIEELEELNEKISIFENAIRGLDISQVCILNYKYIEGCKNTFELESKLFLKESTVKKIHSNMINELTYLLYGDKSVEICG